MSRKPSSRQRFQYLFDNFMSRGTIALIGGLGAVSLLMIFFAAAIVTIGGRILAPEGSDRLTFFEATWVSLMRTLDAGSAYGVHTNPKKSEMRTFAPEDKMIVLAEN